jgi:hypothetical protein
VGVFKAKYIKRVVSSDKETCQKVYLAALLELRALFSFMPIHSIRSNKIKLPYKPHMGTMYGKGKTGKNFNRILGNVWCKSCFTRVGIFHKSGFEYICDNCYV